MKKNTVEELHHNIGLGRNVRKHRLRSTSRRIKYLSPVRPEDPFLNFVRPWLAEMRHSPTVKKPNNIYP